ncbi:MAG: peptide deformylase [Lentisphaeria bacterium]
MLSFLEKMKKPRIMRVVCNGHPALRKVSLPVMTVTAEVRELAARMIVTMLENEIVGVGLAAPQVGVNIRLIVVNTCLDSKRCSPTISPGELLLNPRMPLALLNPQLLSFSEETAIEEEGCLSLPGISGHVCRSLRVMLSASTLDGEKHQVECGGLLARCLQHEIDHLDGTLFYDHLNKEEQSIAAPLMKSLERREKALL